MKALPLLAAFVMSSFLTALPAQDAYGQFVKIFGQAMKFSNDDAIAKAIRSQPAQAIRHFEALIVSQRRTEKKEQYDAPLAKLKTGFTKAWEVDTLDHVERLYRRADADRINAFYKAEENRAKLQREWLKYKQAGDRKGILEIVENALLLGRRCEEIGQKIIAADVYSTCAVMVNGIPNHTEQDTLDTIDYVKMFMAERDAWNWNKDPAYLQWKNWVADKMIKIKVAKKKAEVRKKAGLKDGDGISKFIDGKLAPLVGRLEFKPLKALPVDSCFNGGGVPTNWLSVQIKEKPEKMTWFKKQELYLVRSGASKIGVTVKGVAGKDVTAVEAGTKIKPSLLKLADNSPYSFGFFIGSATEPFAGAITNIAPTKERIAIYYRSMSSWTTTLKKTEITFYDDNCDGLLFTTDPLAYGFKSRLHGYGPKKEQDVPIYDSIKIGKKGAVVPYSRAVKIGDTWYLLSSGDGGKAVTAEALHPDHFDTGTVSMKWSGSRSVKPQLLIIRGRESLQETAFNIAGSKSVEVPAGEYAIAYGRASKGKGSQMMMAHIFRGDSQIIKVEKGKNTVVKLGGPFKFDFKKGGDPTNVELDSLYFRILGAAGEVYGKIQGPTPAPEVVAAKNSSGRGAKVVGSYIGIAGAETLNVASETLAKTLKQGSIRGMGVNVAYFPIVKGDKTCSTVMKFKVPFPGALIGLRLKKPHKLFGKIAAPNFK
jgi:hypothetical protein